MKTDFAFEFERIFKHSFCFVTLAVWRIKKLKLSFVLLKFSEKTACKRTRRNFGMKMKAYFFRTLFSQYWAFFSLALPSLLFPSRVVTTLTSTDSKPYRSEVAAGRAQGSLLHVPEAQVRVADPCRLDMNIDPRIRATGLGIRIRVRILLISSVAFKMLTDHKFVF